MKNFPFNFLFLCSLLVCLTPPLFAQEKLTSFLGGIKYASIRNAVSFDHKMYVFEVIDNNEYVIWKYDFLTGHKEEFFRENPVTGATLYSAFAFGNKLYYCAGNKLFEINEAEEIKEVFSIDGENVRNGYPVGDKLFILTTGSLVWDVFDLFAFDTSTNQVLYKVEDLDVGNSIFYLYELYSQTIPEEMVPMVEKDSVPGIYSYSANDQLIRNPEGSDVLFGQTIEHLTQFKKDQYFFIDTLNQVWYTDLGLNFAQPKFEIPDGYLFEKFSIKGNTLVTLISQEVSPDSQHYIAYRYQFDNDQLDTIDLSNHRTISIVSLESNGIFAVADSTYGFIDFSDADFNIIATISDYDYAWLIEQPGAEEFAFEVTTLGNDKCIYISNRITLETHLVDCDPLTWNFNYPVFEHDSLFLFREHTAEGTKCFKVESEGLEEKFDLYKGYEGRRYELYAFDHTLIGTDRNGLAFQINPSVQQIELEGGNGFLCLERDWFSHGDYIYFQDQTGYRHLRRFPKDGTYAEIVPLFWKYPYPIRADEYDPPFFSINGRIMASMRMDSRLHICELNLETGELDCLVDTTDLYQYVLGSPVFALGDSVCAWIKTNEYGREPWIISRNKSNSFLLKDYNASGDSYVSKVITGQGRSLYNGSFTGGTIRSDGTKPGTYKVSNKIPLWNKEDEFYMIRSITGSDEIVKSYCNSTEVEHLAFAQHIDETYIRGDTLFYIDDDDQLYYWTIGMQEPMYIMDITETALKDIYAGHNVIFIVRGNTNQSLFAFNGTEGNLVNVVDHVGLDDESHSYAAVGDKMLFSHYDPDHGLELWITNGTVAGTQLLYDINPGPENSEPLLLKEHDGYIYFSALHPVEGRQVYRIEKSDLTKITLAQQPELVALNVSPNPSTGVLHIKNLPEVETNEISMYSLSGNRCLFKQSNQSEENLDVSLLSPGLYVLYVQNKTHSSVHKVMIIQ